MKDKSLSFFANPRLRSSLAGALGGFVAWLLIEPTIIPLSSGVKSLWSILPFDFLFCAIAGVTLGLALGRQKDSSQVLKRAPGKARCGARVWVSSAADSAWCSAS